MEGGVVVAVRDAHLVSDVALASRLLQLVPWRVHHVRVEDPVDLALVDLQDFL